MNHVHSPPQAASIGGTARRRPSPPPLAYTDNQKMQALLRNSTVQAKLEVSRTGDPQEREADAVADRVAHDGQVAVPSQAQAPPLSCPSCEAGGTTCAKCEEAKIQRKEKTGDVSRASSSSDSPIAGFEGGGQALSPAVRAFFEPRFGHDFGQVRIHTGAAAIASARAIQARAFTAGRDVAFDAGEYAPEGIEGRKLLAHELTHVIQQGRGSAAPGLIQRQQGPAAAQPVVPDSQPKTNEPLVLRSDAVSEVFETVVITDDREFQKAELRRLIAGSGLKGADDWHSMLLGWRPFKIAPPVGPAHLTGTGAFHPRSPVDAQRDMVHTHLVSLASEIYLKEIRPQAVQFLADFEKQAKDNAESTLKANEALAKAEGIRYGLTAKLSFRRGVGPVPWDPSWFEITYDMDKGSPAAAGLRNAAEVLLKRREKIGAKSAEQQRHMRCHKGECYEDPQYEKLGVEVSTLTTEYNNLRTVLATQYPILDAYSKLDQSAGDLETLARKAAGAEVAAVIGEEIGRKYANIEKVRVGLSDGDVNVWRQSKLVDLARLQLGVADDPMKKRLVDDKVNDEKPGILFDLAVGVLNVLALVLAAPTGGASLVVAAGVNIAVAASHVQDYIMQSALSGTAFDKAQAISADDPSMFWLALEIVGAGLDVGPAASALFKGFKTLAPLVKSAQVAAKGEEAARSLQAVRTAATDIKGAEVAEKIVAQVRNLQKGEAAVIEGAHLTADELKLLQKAGKAAEETAVTGVGKGLKTATGEINLSKSGHIFSCASPCAELGDKYAKIFAQDPALHSEFVQLNGRASDVVQAEKAARQANDAKAILEAEAAVAQLKKDAALLESTIIQAHPDILSLDQLAKLIRQPGFEKGTAAGNKLRYVRYQRTTEGAIRPFAEWEVKANRIWRNSAGGTLTEKELQEAMDLGLKNIRELEDPVKKISFIPDFVDGFPEALEWGKAYHFREIKDWQSMSNTGNLKAMLEYVRTTPGATITLYYKSNTAMSGPLKTIIEDLIKAKKAELIPFAGRT